MTVVSRYDRVWVLDPAGVAKRLGADGYGIVWAVIGSGIHGPHPHFRRYENLLDRLDSNRPRAAT